MDIAIRRMFPLHAHYPSQPCKAPPLNPTMQTLNPQTDFNSSYLGDVYLSVASGRTGGGSHGFVALGLEHDLAISEDKFNFIRHNHARRPSPLGEGTGVRSIHSNKKNTDLPQPSVFSFAYFILYRPRPKNSITPLSLKY